MVLFMQIVGICKKLPLYNIPLYEAECKLKDKKLLIYFYHLNVFTTSSYCSDMPCCAVQTVSGSIAGKIEDIFAVPIH